MINNKLKVLFLTNILSDYNIPVLDLLGKKVDLTVAHTGKKLLRANYTFSERLLHTYKLGPLVFNREKLYPLACGYDAILITADIKWISYMRLAFYKKRPFSICFWGIGVSASYTKRFDENKRWDKVRNYFMRHAESLIFYSEYPINKYRRANFDNEKLFVAHNTVEVQYGSNKSEKDSLIFIGTLYKQKGLLSLLQNYHRAYHHRNDLPKLNIIGGGDYYEDIKLWIASHNLTGHIFMHGPIYDEQRLAIFFQKAIACISPGQAGLSVLKSMGYGTPFITMNNAITGGERFNIITGENGILYENEDDLEQILIDIVDNKQKYVAMGERARSYYMDCRTPRHMAEGLFKALEYSKKSGNKQKRSKIK